MPPINPVDINTHIAQGFIAGKLKAAQNAGEHGQARYPDMLKEKYEDRKNSVKEVTEVDNNGIDPDAENNNSREQKRKKRKKEEEEKKKKIRELFGKDLKNSKGSSIDIKL